MAMPSIAKQTNSKKHKQEKKKKGNKNYDSNWYFTCVTFE